MLRRTLSAAVLPVLLASSLMLVGCKGDFVGSNLSLTYHDPSCVWAEGMNKDRRVWFSTADEAEEAGYVACRTCLDPSSGTNE